MAKKPMKFEESLALLEKIVEELETGDLTLDESLARYEQGVEAFRKCHEMLRDAEKRVEQLLQAGDGTERAVPFDAEATAAPGDTPKAEV